MDGRYRLACACQTDPVGRSHLHRPHQSRTPGWPSQHLAVAAAAAAAVGRTAAAAVVAAVGSADALVGTAGADPAGAWLAGAAGVWPAGAAVAAAAAAASVGTCRVDQVRANLAIQTFGQNPLKVVGVVAESGAGRSAAAA